MGAECTPYETVACWPSRSKPALEAGERAPRRRGAFADRDRRAAGGGMRAAVSSFVVAGSVAMILMKLAWMAGGLAKGGKRAWSFRVRRSGPAGQVGRLECPALSRDEHKLHQNS